MFFLKAIYCRTVQAVLRLLRPFFPYREPKVFPSCANLAEVFQKEKIKSLLLVTDRGIIENGLVRPLEEILSKNGVTYTIYDKTQPNPTIENVEEARELYRQSNSQAIIAIGGGSSIDCAKAVGARVAHPEKPIEKMAGIFRVRRRLPTLMVIPTTAGTGSEVSPATVVSDRQKRIKHIIISFPLIPRYTVLDASLTYSLPPKLTASTGMDALTHAVEAYIGQSTTKETRRLALEATRLIFRNVHIAYIEGDNHEARENMLRGAYKAGLAFSKSYVGYIHAIAHSLSGRYDTPHGLANSVIMPYVLEAYGPIIHMKLKELGLAAGVCTEQDSEEKAAFKLIKAIRWLNTSMGLPDKLPGIKKEDIPLLARRAEKGANPLFPVPKLLTREELESFYYRIADWS